MLLYKESALHDKKNNKIYKKIKGIVCDFVSLNRIFLSLHSLFTVFTKIMHPNRHLTIVLLNNL